MGPQMCCGFVVPGAAHVNRLLSSWKCTDSGVWPALPRAQAWVFSCLDLSSLLSEVDPVGPDDLKAPGALSTYDFLSPSCRCLMATNTSESGVWGYATVKTQCHVTESSRTLEK